MQNDNILSTKEDNKVHLDRENAKWSREEEMTLIKHISGGSPIKDLENISF